MNIFFNLPLDIIIATDELIPIQSRDVFSYG